MVRPYELYVRFLVSKGPFNLESVNRYLSELSLAKVTQDDIERQYDILTDSVQASIARQMKTGHHAWFYVERMVKIGLGELWLYEKEYRTPDNAHLKFVYDIHYDPQLRIVVNALLTKKTPHKDICQAVNHKFSAMLTVEHLAVYEKYFWDVSRMTRSAWREYLASCDDRERSVLFYALTEPLDAVKTYLGLPSKVSVPDELQFLLVSSIRKARHYLELSTQEANEEARAWISQAAALADKYEKHRTGDVDDFSKTIQMDFDYVDAEFPTPDAAILADTARKVQE